MIYPVPRGSLEALVPEIRPLDSAPELQGSYLAWRRSRDQFIADFRAGAAAARWQKHYFHGLSSLGDVFKDHQTKLEVRHFRDYR